MPNRRLRRDGGHAKEQGEGFTSGLQKNRSPVRQLFRRGGLSRPSRYGCGLEGNAKTYEVPVFSRDSRKEGVGRTAEMLAWSAIKWRSDSSESSR